MTSNSGPYYIEEPPIRFGSPLPNVDLASHDNPANTQVGSPEGTTPFSYSLFDDNQGDVPTHPPICSICNSKDGLEHRLNCPLWISHSSRPSLSPMVGTDGYHANTLLTSSTNRKKFFDNTCEVCGKHFRYPKDLKRHHQVHFPSHRFECGCGSRFSRKDALARHINKYHPGMEVNANRSDSTAGTFRGSAEPEEKIYLCDSPGCDRSAEGFSTFNDLDRHKKSLHGLGSNTECYSCPSANCQNSGKTWTRLDNLKAHIIRMHPTEDPNDLTSISKLRTCTIEPEDCIENRYRVVRERDRAKFYVPGRVFAVPWTENADRFSNKDDASSDSSYSEVRYGQLAFTEIRTYIVVRNRGNFSQCVPVLSKGVNGSIKPTENMSAYTAVFMAEDPNIPLTDNLKDSPIRVRPKGGRELKPESYINFHKVYCVEHYCPVLYVGKVEDDDLDLLETYWTQAVLR